MQKRQVEQAPAAMPAKKSLSPFTASQLWKPPCGHTVPSMLASIVGTPAAGAGAAGASVFTSARASMRRGREGAVG